MTKAIPVVLVLALACLFNFSTALPSVLNQTQTKPNAPRTLLGKPYRRRWDSQDCPPSRWTLAITDCNDSDVDVDHVSAHQAQVGNGGWTRTKMDTKLRVRLPLPLVLNVSPESGPARLRLMRSKRPMWYSPCLDNAPQSSQARSDGIPKAEDEQRVQSPVVSRSESKKGSREMLVPVRRSKRLYDRGEWKSRLFEEY